MIEVLYAFAVAILGVLTYLIYRLIVALEKDVAYKKQVACETRMRQQGSNVLCMKLLCGGKTDGIVETDKKPVWKA